MNATTDLAEAIRSGQRRALARAITLVESTRSDDRERAVRLLDALYPASGKALRLAISGVPGVGKSTLIDTLGGHIIGSGRRVAVLTIDPSSALTGGSILGDKTRMEYLSREPNAFVRPSPSGLDLGGVARRTREAIILVEAAGYDVVIVETVGVGQAEIAAAAMTDAFVLLLLPAAGDELQGIKRGIVEMADFLLINKADGELRAAAQHAAADYRSALQLMRSRTSGWRPPVAICSALSNDGIDTFWQSVLSYQAQISASGALARRRGEQARSWLWEETRSSLLAALGADTGVRSKLAELEIDVTDGKMLAPVAARRLLDLFLHSASAVRP